MKRKLDVPHGKGKKRERKIGKEVSVSKELAGDRERDISFLKDLPGELQCLILFSNVMSPTDFDVNLNLLRSFLSPIPDKKVKEQKILSCLNMALRVRNIPVETPLTIGDARKLLTMDAEETRNRLQGAIENAIKKGAPVNDLSPLVQEWTKRGTNWVLVSEKKDFYWIEALNYFLHIAIQNNNESAVKVLLEAGASPRIPSVWWVPNAQVPLERATEEPIPLAFHPLWPFLKSFESDGTYHPNVKKERIAHLLTKEGANLDLNLEKFLLEKYLDGLVESTELVPLARDMVWTLTKMGFEIGDPVAIVHRVMSDW